MSRRGPAETWREGVAAHGLLVGWRAVFGGIVLAAMTGACGPGTHYGLANAPSVTRDWHADDRARDAVANGSEACEPDRSGRDRRGRARDRDRTAHLACADRGLFGIPARGGAPPR
jgi:hypothetical protein